MTTRKRLPNRRKSKRFTITLGVADIHVSAGEYTDGTLGEIFIDYSREGTFGRDMVKAFAMSVSIGLQHGVPLETFQHTFRHFKMEPDIVRGVFAELEMHYAPKEVAP